MIAAVSLTQTKDFGLHVCDSEPKTPMNTQKNSQRLALALVPAQLKKIVYLRYGLGSAAG